MSLHTESCCSLLLLLSYQISRSSSSSRNDTKITTLFHFNCAFTCIPCLWCLPYDYNKTSDSSSLIQPPSSSCQHTIAIIGAGGYIGSKVLNHFRMSAKGYDRNPSRFQRIHPENTTTSIPAITKMASVEIPLHELRCFKHILYLGGLTGRLECSNAGSKKVYEENVVDITLLAERMHAGQTLIFASTSFGNNMAISGLWHGQCK